MAKTLTRVAIGVSVGFLILAAAGLPIGALDFSAMLSDLYDSIGKWLELLIVVTLGAFLGLQLDRHVHRDRGP